MTPSTPCQARDGSITLNGSAQQVLAADPYRCFLILQAPAGAVTFSFITSTPSAGAAGCFTVAANTFLQISPVVPGNPLYAIGTNTQVLSVTVASQS